jgi:PAS domain S-box-containing protein
MRRGSRSGAGAMAESPTRTVEPRRSRRSAEKTSRASRVARPRPATWDWDLASGRVEWDATFRALFGYAETVTDAAWREDRIHPDDRERVTLSLQRATIANPGKAWSEEYRFRKADGSYVPVFERARVVQDGAGPVKVLGAISPRN